MAIPRPRGCLQLGWVSAKGAVLPLQQSSAWHVCVPEQRGGPMALLRVSQEEKPKSGPSPPAQIALESTELYVFLMFVLGGTKGRLFVTQRTAPQPPRVRAPGLPPTPSPGSYSKHVAPLEGASS